MKSKKQTTELPPATIEKLITFRDDTIKLCKNRGKISLVTELVLEDAQETIEVCCLKDVPGVSFFTLGPVYITARVPYSLLDQYRGETQEMSDAKDAQFLTFETPAFSDALDVLEGGGVVGTWGNKLHAVQTETFGYVTEFFIGQVLKRDTKLYGITYQDILLQDPVLRDKHGIRDEDLIKVRLFLPFTKRGYLAPYLDIHSGYLKFTVRPSTPEMCKTLKCTAQAYALEHP